MGNESDRVWNPLKRELDKMYFTYQRFEDKLTPGIPDVNIFIPRLKKDVWVELKFCYAPKGRTVDIGLRPEQYIWMRDAKKSGRNVLLLAKVGDYWFSWADARDWEAAKHPANWRTLQRRASKFIDPGAFLSSLL